MLAVRGITNEWSNTVCVCLFIPFLANKQGNSLWWIPSRDVPSFHWKNDMNFALACFKTKKLKKLIHSRSFPELKKWKVWWGTRWYLSRLIVWTLACKYVIKNGWIFLIILRLYLLFICFFYIYMLDLHVLLLFMPKTDPIKWAKREDIVFYGQMYILPLPNW